MTERLDDQGHGDKPRASVLRDELVRLQEWFKDREDRPGHKAQVIHIGMALAEADRCARSAGGTSMEGRDMDAPEQPCAGCGKPLVRENAWMEDGCPCNTPAGVNNSNLYRWRLLHELQQQQSHSLSSIRSTLSATQSASEESITLADIREQIDHIEQNGFDLKKYGGQDADEGRCRELCALFLRDFINAHEMQKQIDALDRATKAPADSRAQDNPASTRGVKT